MGRLQGITVDIEGVSALAYFEVIDIVDDSNPYLVPLGIDWETNMNRVINLKKCKMIFEKKSLRVVVPIITKSSTEGCQSVRLCVTTSNQAFD